MKVNVKEAQVFGWYRLTLLVGKLFCFAGLLSAISLSVLATEKKELSERVTFTEKLRIKEQQNRERVMQLIDAASEKEYRQNIKNRLTTNFTDERVSSATVVVDVTSMVNSQRNISSPQKKGPGWRILESQVTTSKNQNTDKRNERIPKLKITETKASFSNGDKNKHFEMLNVDINNLAAEILLAEPRVKDIVVTQENNSNFLVSINIENGRIYPAQTPVEYDDAFLKQGYFEELMESFDSAEQLQIFVRVKGEPQDWRDQNDESKKRGSEKIDAVLLNLSANDYELIEKDSYHFVVSADRSIATQLFNDDRVQVVNDRQLYSSKIDIRIQ